MAAPASRARSPSLLTRRLGLTSEEARILALMGALVATLMCAYTIAKVLRDALFLAEFGALKLPFAYLGVAIASVVFVWLEGWLVRRFTRIGAGAMHQGMAVAFSALAALVFLRAPHRTAALFYVWTGSQAMMLLPHFWVMALDTWDSRRARRLFPLLTGCGLIGGLLGGAIAGAAMPLLGRGGLMWMLPALFMLTIGLTRMIEARRPWRPSPVDAPAMSRWEILRRSRYLRVFAAGLMLSVIVSTLVDFQFKVAIQRMFPDPRALTTFLGVFYVVLNGMALLFQFSAAGWLIQRFGLQGATGVQPTSVMLFSLWMVLSTGGWIVIAMRWIQGVVFQTLGKSSFEIYYTAIHPQERRAIKPVVDTLAERWSDAIVGVLLIVVLHVFHASLPLIAFGTLGLAAVWLVLLVPLNRDFGRAFENALSRRWVEPVLAPESLRMPAARRALLSALRSADEPRVILALELAVAARDRAVAQAVRECLGHSSPAVRAAAVTAMDELRLPDPARQIAPWVDDPDDALRRAALRYELSRPDTAIPVAERLLEHDDPARVRELLEILGDRPRAASVVTPAWIESRLARSGPEERVLAALAVGVLPGRAPHEPLRALLADSDPEVRRAALRSAARRPDRDLLPAILPLLADPTSAFEARDAVAAAGNLAVPALARMLAGDDSRAQAVAARALAGTATPRAANVLTRVARRGDARGRQLALRALVRIRLRIGVPVVSRTTAHRLFLRELRDVRDFRAAARPLAGETAPELKLLMQSELESAELALGRAVEALACWYEPRPLLGALERLRSEDPAHRAPALEYLGHVLPGSVFRSMGELFEEPAPDRDPEAVDVESIVESAVRAPDPWLRAVAVRAAIRFGDTAARWLPANDPSPLVQAELAALAAAGAVATADAGRPAPAVPTGEPTPRASPC